MHSQKARSHEGITRAFCNRGRRLLRKQLLDQKEGRDEVERYSLGVRLEYLQIRRLSQRL